MITKFDRRLIAVPVSVDFLTEMVTLGWQTRVDCITTCIRGLPIGATFVSSFFDNARFIAYLVFQHESFDEVPPGTMIPELWPLFETKQLEW